MSESFNSSSLRDRLYRDVNVSQHSMKDNRPMFKSTLTPKITRKFGSSRTDRLPPVVFENGSIVMSFTKDVSSIPKKTLAGNPDSTLLDSTILKGLNKSTDLHPFHNRSGLMPPSSFYQNPEQPKSKEKDYMTPMDFIELVRKDPEVRDEFCYMLKESNAYDWRLVNFGDKEKQMRKQRHQTNGHEEYMTISSRGIVHTIDGEETFISLDEWEREYTIYNKLKKIDFFSHYKLWKNFMLWRKLRRRTNFKKKRAFLENNLFVIDDILSKPLLDIREECYEIHTRASMIEWKANQTKALIPFENDLNENQQSETEWINLKVNSKIKKTLSDCCKKSLDNFKRMNGIKNTDPDGQANVEDRPMVIGNDSGKEMPYTQKATIRIHYKKLKKYIRLVDYLVQDAKIGYVNNSLIKVDRFLDMSNHVLANKTRNNGGIIPILIVKPEIMGDQMIFNPSIDRILKTFDDTISRGLHYICDQHSMLVNAPEFTVYATGDNVKENVDTIDLHYIISHHDMYIYYKERIIYLLRIIFDYLVNTSSDLDEILEIVLKCRKFTPDMLENQERQTLYELIETLVYDDEALKKIVEKVEVGIFNFERDELKQEILEVATECLNLIDENLPVIITRRSLEFVRRMEVIQAKLSNPVTGVKRFIEHMKVFEDCKEEFEDLQEEYTKLQDLTLLFGNEIFRIKCPDDCRIALTNLKTSKDTVKKIIDDIDEKLDRDTQKYKKELTALVPQLEIEKDDISEMLKQLEVDNPERDPEQLAEQLDPLKKEIDDIVAKGEEYQKFQLILNMDVTNLDDISEFKKTVGTYHTFWHMKANWNKYIDSLDEVPLKDIKVEEMRKTIDTNFKKVNVMMKEIEGNQCFKEFKEEMERNKGVVLVLESFAVKALEEAEWEEIKDILREDTSIHFIDFDYESTEFTLPILHAMEVVKYKQEISDISTRAAKEKVLKSNLMKIEEFLNNITFNTEIYKSDKTINVLANNDELIKKLDASLVEATNILSSKYVTRIKDQVQQEQKRLLYFQEIVDEIGFCQRMWMYLEPIFRSDESNRELAKERKTFMTQVHAPFIKITKDLSENIKSFISKIKRQDPTFKTNVLGIHTELEALEKKLISYLERKRKTFPRFYFISNDDLIEILSQAKEFEKVQGHLNKLFDSVKRIVLDPETYQMKGLLSPDGETLLFDSPQGFNTSDAITEVLNRVQALMQSNVKSMVRTAYRELSSKPDQRTAWLMGDYNAQAILTADSLLWTISTENCLEHRELIENDEGSRDEYEFSPELMDHLIESMLLQLKDVIEIVRGPLKPTKRRMINSLITQDIHYRDIVENLREEEISTKDDFKWQQQLRFYMKEADVSCRQVSTVLNYGNEYLGIPSKLAITPLTDRCWLTITSALYLHLGCSPVGPAGTGKTESTKDLAKNIGTLCIVYNCSEQVTVSIMSQHFLGVMHTGGWLCLDEFNRIDIEVLSVIAQQVLSMRHGLITSSSDSEATIYFEGEPISKDDSSMFKHLTVFTTMNPGYTGRTELPDNLKVLFRSVSMMVPDYSIIAEILLFSEGFFNAKDLAVKLTKLYKLASEQLSQQKHYDFGMRAVKSILSMAGNLKRANPKESEDILLIQAMNDTNIPKFLESDIKLFEAIVHDLFPSAVYQKQEKIDFLEEMKENIRKNDLQEIPKFIEKCLQFDDIMKIRFGNMLLGPPISGKSKVLQILEQTYCTIAEKEGRNSETMPVYSVTLNPKSITMGELYGQVNLSGDFTNGLAAKVFSDFVANESRIMKWIIFDGPVDSLWIENLNSVLDDSMTLCLANGKRVKLRHDIRVLFEVQDLKEASPATVSRIGMVYLDSNILHHMDVIKTLFQKEFKKVQIPESHKEGYISRADSFFDKLLLYLRKNCREPTKTINNNLVYSFVKIIKTFYELEEYEKRYPFEDEEDIKKQEANIIGRIFIFAATWSLMATLDEFTSVKLEQMAFNLFNANDMPRGSFYDCFLDLKEKDNLWVKWEAVLPEFTYEPTMKWSDILVPTISTLRYSYLLRRAILTKYPIYLSGITGTGKTVICQNVIKEMNEQQLITPLQFTFSAKTSSSQVQNQIVSKMNTLRIEKYTVMGLERIICLTPNQPPKSLVVHIDDINMPEVETYGAQPPIELLRQALDQGGFYDRQYLQWRKIENTVFIASSVPPGNGRAPLTERFMRHFHLLNIHSGSDEIMKGIFGKILKGFLQSFEFKPKIKTMDTNLVMGTLLLYREILYKLLPTPKKSHYTFNLRDVSKVFQGLVKMRPQKFQDSDTVAKLWIHECTRVFCDRLATDKDREFFATTLSGITGTYAGLSVSPSEILENIFIFGDFVSSNRELEYLDKTDKIVKSINMYMAETKINIELFSDSIKHLCRINRILRQVGGHGLLIGVGGSGKKSLITVGAEMAGTILCTIEPTRQYGVEEFRKEVFEKMLIPTGAFGQDVTFMLTDTEVVDERFLEDVNNLINTGELPLEKTLIEKLKKETEPEMLKLKVNEDPIEFFFERVRNKLHIMLAMSPVGDKLRTRVRNFPSFVNCCTVDWLDPWPEDALSTVATHMLADTFKEQNLDVDIGTALIKACIEGHQGSIQAADDFLTLQKRRVYITPKTYIDLIRAFKSVLKEMKGSIESNINKLTNGLSKLIESGEKVEIYKQEIERTKPILEDQNIKIKALIETLTAEREVVDNHANVVDKEKAVAERQAEQIKNISSEVKLESDKARAVLEEATKDLDKLNRGEISELKKLKIDGVQKDLLECVQMFIGKPTDEKSIRSTLANADFITQLKTLKVRSITKEMVTTVKQKIKSNPNMNETKLKTINASLIGLFNWINGMMVAQESDEVVSRLEIREAEVTKLYENQKAELDKKQKELDAIMAKLKELQTSYDTNLAKQQELDNNLKRNQMMLNNSGKLTKGLEEEHERWKETVKTLEESKIFIVGDAFLASACLAYYGPFTGLYRQNLLNLWQDTLAGLKLKFSPKFALHDAIGSVTEIRNWNVKGLPSNDISTCNGILVKRSTAFPYMIDPQLQANKWIKNMEAGEDIGLKIIKAKDTERLQMVLEECVQNNFPLLIEDAEEYISPVLEPLLTLKVRYSAGDEERMNLKLSKGDDTIVDPNFKLYFTTKIPNPSFLPELFIRVNVINFTVTEDGLEEQLLAEVVRVVMPEIEDKRVQLTLDIANGKNMLVENENKILEELKNSRGNILENNPLIENLEQSKQNSTKVKEILEENSFMQGQVETARNKYRPVAIRGSLLYFIICDLAEVDPMYQFSLVYITRLFVNTIKASPRTDSDTQNCENFVKNITEAIYLNVCRGLFNEHKKIFAFLVATKIQKRDGGIKALEWDLFLKGIPMAADYNKDIKIPGNVQVEEKCWDRLFYLASFCQPVGELVDHMTRDAGLAPQVIDHWCKNPDPLNANFPKEYNQKLTLFQKMLILQCFRPNAILVSMISFVEHYLGSIFVANEAPKFDEVFKDCDYKTPMIFVLSPGSDPFQSLQKFADEKGVKMTSISLGQSRPV